VLDLQQGEEYHSGAMLYSPRKVAKANACEAVKEQYQHQEQLAKANRKQLREAAKAYKKQQADEKRAQREAAKVVRDQEKAEKEARRVAKLAAQNTKKPLKTSQIGKRKASQAPQPKAKRTRQVGGDEAGSRWREAQSAAPARTTTRGRSTKPRRIFE
jgi:hypothetical protein